MFMVSESFLPPPMRSGKHSVAVAAAAADLIKSLSMLVYCVVDFFSVANLMLSGSRKNFKHSRRSFPLFPFRRCFV